MPTARPCSPSPGLFALETLGLTAIRTGFPLVTALPPWSIPALVGLLIGLSLKTMSRGVISAHGSQIVANLASGTYTIAVYGPRSSSWGAQRPAASFEHFVRAARDGGTGESRTDT